MYAQAIKHRTARQFVQSPATSLAVGEQQINRFLAVFVVAVVGGVSAPESHHLLWLPLLLCNVPIVFVISL